MNSRRSLSLTLLVIGVLLPVITYFGGHIFNTNLASYGGPPNQGEMVVTYFAFLASLAVGACTALAGIAVSFLSTRKSATSPSG